MRRIAVVVLAGIFAILLSSTSALAGPLYAINDNLISCWDLDETSGTRNDAVGANHLTDNNTVGYTAGVQSNAATFVEASSESLTRASNSTLQMDSTGFSVSMWIKPSNNNATLFLRKASEYRVEYSYTTPVTLKATFGTANIVSTSSLPSSGNWHHVVATFNADTDTCTLYVDGSQAAQSTGCTSTTTTNTNQLYIGPIAGDEDHSTDIVSLFKRELSSSDVTYLYNSGSGRTCSQINATATPTPTATSTATNTPTATATDTPTNTPVGTATNTPTPTDTATPTDTPTATATDTPGPSPTSSDTPVPTATDTPAPTATDTPVPTATNTPLPTATPGGSFTEYILSDGTTLILERRITYGDMAVAGAVGLAIVVALIYGIIRLVELWLH